MKNFLALFFLGLLQGVTEFLPVSSSGHLVLFSKLFGIEDGLFISILLHFATLLSVVTVFYKDIWFMICHPFSRETISIVVATIPTCIIVLIIMPIVKGAFSGAYLSVSFAISALLLFFAETYSEKRLEKKFDYKSAFFMGIAQGFAIFPGVSRSGSTISAGLLNKNKKEDVAKFSFLMSLPIIFLSMIMEIYEIFVNEVSIDIEIFPLVLSFVIAYFVGIFAIKFMLKMTKRSNLKWFSLYLVVISIITLFVL